MSYTNIIPTTSILSKEMAMDMLIEKLSNCSNEEKAALLETIEDMPCKWNDELNVFEFTLPDMPQELDEHIVQKDRQPRQMTGYMRSGLRRKKHTPAE